MQFRAVLFTEFLAASHKMSSVGRAVSASRRPADRKLWALRDDVLRLEEELTVSRAQLDKVTSKFNCLVELLHKYDCFHLCVCLCLHLCIRKIAVGLY